MADQNSIFYKLGLAVKQQVAAGAFNTVDSAFTGTTTAENLTLSDDLVVNGDLTVLGATTQTKITETNLDIKDNFIGLNRGASALPTANEKDIGLYFERGSNQSAGAIVFDEANDKFVVGFIEASAGGYQVSITTNDGVAKVDVSGALWDAVYAKYVEGEQQSITFTVSNAADSNANGLAEAETQIEFYLDHPTVNNASSGVFFDGAGSEAELITAINALDFSGQSPETTGQITAAVVVGNGTWDSSHSFVARYANANSMEIRDMATVSDLSAISSYTTLSLTSASGAVLAGAADASAEDSGAVAGPLKVSALEINDASEGALSLGDFADFEAALAAS